MRSTLVVLVALVALTAGCLAGEEIQPENLTEQGTEEPPADQGTEEGPPSNGTPSSNASSSDPTTNASSPDPGTEDVPAPGDRAAEPLAFTGPIRVNDERPAFEPSISVGPNGTIYVTAARLRQDPSGTTEFMINDPVGSSPVWFSTDDGASWQRMPSPQDVHRALPGLEGDLAVDAGGSVYFVDLAGPDNTFTRWSVNDGEPAWETTRPVQGTTTYLDDRPWIAAHGNGTVYYLGNTGVDGPDAPSVAPAQPGEKVWFHASEDAGRTWSPGLSFPDSWWCTLAPSKVQVGTVHIGCSMRRADGADEGAIFTSTDGGDTFSSTTVATFGSEALSTDEFVGTAADEGGNVYLAFPDDNLSDEAPGQLKVGVKTANGTTRSLNVTPFAGSFGNVWAAAGSEGTLAVAFHATRDVPDTNDSRWYPYVLVSGNADEPDPRFQLARLDARPASTGNSPPLDFFQVDVGPQDRVHVAFPRDPAGDGSIAGPILYAGQTAGANLDGRS